MQPFTIFISSWRKRFNRNRSFQKQELDELEDHLIEEAEYFVKRENLTEEEAFCKAEQEIGSREELSEALLKVKRENNTKKRLSLILCMTILISISTISLFLFKSYSLEKDRFMNSIPFGFPCPGPIEAGYGYRIHPIFQIPDFHTGVDIPAPYGSNLTATGDGVVIGSGWEGGYGMMVTIQHSDTLTSRYAHCSKLLVKVGEKVKRGQIIALVGATGTAISSQVHYEIFQDGQPVDPVKFNTDFINKNSSTKKE